MRYTVVNMAYNTRIPVEATGHEAALVKALEEYYGAIGRWARRGPLDQMLFNILRNVPPGELVYTVWNAEVPAVGLYVFCVIEGEV